jgi:hypothetical protein
MFAMLLFFTQQQTSFDYTIQTIHYTRKVPFYCKYCQLFGYGGTKLH